MIQLELVDSRVKIDRALDQDKFRTLAPDQAFHQAGAGRTVVAHSQHDHGSWWRAS
jgi:hypothetical protein